MDGSTDTSSTENKLIMIIYCKKDDNTQEMWLCIRYVSMEGLLKTDSEGLILTKFYMMNFGCSKSLPCTKN